MHFPCEDTGSNPVEEKVKWIQEKKMTLRQLKAFTASCRNTILNIFEKNTDRPLKSKTKGFGKSKAGRNNSGSITMYRRGGGHKRSYRKINHYSFEGHCVLENFEYDPNRNAWIARLFSIKKKEHFYALATQNLKVGQTITSEESTRLNLGNRCLLKNVPLGAIIHSLGSNTRPQFSVFQRAAGTFAQIVQKNSLFCTVKLSSGQNKEFLPNTSVTIGRVSNVEDRFQNLGKAGRNRWLGNRPKVRGVAMNPVDHPHGGGEGKSSGGRPSVTPWSRPAHGKKTKK